MKSISWADKLKTYYILNGRKSEEFTPLQKAQIWLITEEIKIQYVIAQKILFAKLKFIRMFLFDKKHDERECR